VILPRCLFDVGSLWSRSGPTTEIFWPSTSMVTLSGLAARLSYHAGLSAARGGLCRLPGAREVVQQPVREVPAEPGPKAAFDVLDVAAGGRAGPRAYRTRHARRLAPMASRDLWRRRPCR
jgi:hypothetical protein